MERYPYAIRFLRRVAPNGHRDEAQQIEGVDAGRCHIFGKSLGGTGLEWGHAGVLRSLLSFGLSLRLGIEGSDMLGINGGMRMRGTGRFDGVKFAARSGRVRAGTGDRNGVLFLSTREALRCSELRGLISGLTARAGAWLAVRSGPSRVNRPPLELDC